MSYHSGYSVGHNKRSCPIIPTILYGIPAQQSVLTEAIKDSIEGSKSSKAGSAKNLDTIEMTLIYIRDKLEKVHNDLKLLRDIMQMRR